MGTPRVTIAIPVRDGADFLAQAIDSALGQTHPDLEIVVVDDGSRDGGATAAIARRYGDRIRFIQQENTGVAGALNTVLREMTGEYFCWLSHDDLFEPEKTAIQVAAHDRAGGRKDVVLYSDFTWIDETGRVTGVERLDRDALARQPRLAFYDGLINGCTIFAARELLLEGGGIAQGYPHTQDYQTWRRLVDRACLLHVPIPLVRVRRHRGQGSRSRAALDESEAFWTSVVRDTSDFEAALVDGSRERFLRRSADFLRFRSPNRRVADVALDLARTAGARAGVSVVLDLGPDIARAGPSIASVLAQDRRPDQLVLVGPRDALASELDAMLACSGIEVVRVVAADVRSAARLRAGLLAATGSYIAFLLAPDAYEPAKIAEQVEAMSASGCIVSHTSYRKPDGTVVPSGCFSGYVYPEILGGMAIETSTVMIHRVLWASGTIFVDTDAVTGASWIDASAGRELLGLDEPLSCVDPSTPSDAARLLGWAKAHARHRDHRSDLARLELRARREGPVH